MGVRTRVSAEQELVIVAVDGGFGALTWPDLQKSCQVAQKQASYVVDFAKASHITTSALGMLLLLREHAGFDSARVRLVNCAPDVRHVLTIACFEQLFDIAEEPVLLKD
jgi:anti-anti-sigma factor